MVKQDILNALKRSKIKAYEVETGLDVDCDVVLKNCDIVDFIEFCNSVNKKVVFYKFVNLELVDYLVDELSVKSRIREIIEGKLNDIYHEEEGLSVDTFEEEINKKMLDIQKHNAEVKKKFSALKQPEILFASIYVIYEGVQVGVDLENGYMENYPMAFEIEDDLEEEVLKLIADKLSLYEMDDDARLDRWERELEERRAKEKEIREAALAEISDFVSNDDSLCKYTNQKLRHAYSKRLAEEYSEKYDFLITISSVEIVVEEIYRKLK